MSKKPRGRGHSYSDEQLDRFIEALEATGVAKRAAEAAGMSERDAYRLRKRNPEFAERWGESMSGKPRGRGYSYSDEQLDRFIEVLEATGMAKRAAEAAGMDERAAYRRRKRNPEFAERWAAARARADGGLHRVRGDASAEPT